MIDDRIEDGMSEEEAVAALGSIDGIVSEVCAGIGAESDGQAEPEDGVRRRRRYRQRFCRRRRKADGRKESSHRQKSRLSP